MSSKSDKAPTTAAFGWAVIVWAASLAVAVNCDSVFEVNTTALHGQAIQLVVTWDGVGSRGRYVDLTIRNAVENQTCADVSCQRLGIDAERGMQMLPEEINFIQDSRDCEFDPGCSYHVIFKYEDKAERFRRNITIPDCVEGICRCDYDDKFPNFTTNLSYEERTETLHFQWSIDMATDHLEVSELTSFIVRYFKVHNTQTAHFEDSYEPHLVLLNQSSAESPWRGTEELLLPRTYFGVDDKGQKDRLTVEVFLLDSKSCHGASEIVNLELIRAKPKDSHWIQTSLIVVTVAAALALITALVCKRSKLGRHIIAKLFRLPIYYSNIDITNNSMTRNSFAMQENHIYVEKELYEGKVSGLVDNYEISPSSLTFGPEIGKGAFGRVFIAQAQDATIVAVKRLKKRPTEEDAEEFFNEITTMKKVGLHENIISLLGCCTLRQPVLIVMEYIGKGDLHKYLTAIRKHQFGSNAAQQSARQSAAGVVVGKTETGETESASESEGSTDSDNSYVLQNEKPLRPSLTETLYTTVSSQNSDDACSDARKIEYVLDHQELQRFAIQIANGMAHLEELDITHRDLAARNILIDGQKRLKISDFGLSRCGVYVTTKMKKRPLRWLSIEAIRRSLYSSKSDVWAFGVVMWEIATLGLFPYEGTDNYDVLPFLLGGGRLKQPDTCSDKLYDVMLRCWRENPLERPSFSQLLEILQEPEQKIYIDLDEMGDNDVFYEQPIAKAE